MASSNVLIVPPYGAGTWHSGLFDWPPESARPKTHCGRAAGSVISPPSESEAEGTWQVKSRCWSDVPEGQSKRIRSNGPNGNAGAGLPCVA